MRVALIAPLVSPLGAAQLGGAQSVVSDLAGALTERGHDVTVYAARGSVVDAARLAPVDVDPVALGADLFRHGAPAAPSAAMEDAYRAVYTHVAGASYDVVHNHGFDTPAVRIAAELGIAVLHTLHLPPSGAMAAAVTEARGAGASVWCAGVSRAHTRAWRALLEVDAVLPNGVPVGHIPFSPAVDGDAPALVAARFSAEKGIAEGIAAARTAQTAVDVYGVRYDDAYEQDLRARWGGDAGVRFHAPVARDRLWAVMGRAAVVLCLARWDEPFGMVAAEAQAAGTPVVASRAGGLPEVVDDGVTGRLVDGAVPADAVAALHAARTLSRAACRGHAEKSLGLRSSAAANEAVYLRLARGGARGSS